jgi:cell division protein FtsB
MPAELAMAIVALCVTAAVQLGGLLIWGAGLTHRVKAIEREIEPLKALSHQVTRMDARLEGLLEQMKDLNAAIRWMREPRKHKAEK